MLDILTYIVVVLTLVVGLSILTSNRHMRGRLSAVSLALAYFGAAFWALFVQLFRNSTDPWNAHVFHQLFSVVALLVPIGCILYAFSIYKRHIASFIICGIVFLVIATVGYLIITQPNSFYSSIVMVDSNNYAVFADHPLVLAYTGIFGLCLTSSVAMIFARMFRIEKGAPFRRGLFWVGCGLLLSAGLCLVFNVIMPFMGSWGMFWVGPLSIAIAMLFTYFATLKYRLFINSSKMIQYSTYLVVVTMAALVYICIFYLVFMLIFRGASPSNEITIFQFIMTVIVILFLPTINHFIEYIRHMITKNGVIEIENKDDAKQ